MEQKTEQKRELSSEEMDKIAGGWHDEDENRRYRIFTAPDNGNSDTPQSGQPERYNR